jgi:hypothetical protein
VGERNTYQKRLTIRQDLPVVGYEYITRLRLMSDKTERQKKEASLTPASFLQIV